MGMLSTEFVQILEQFPNIKSHYAGCFSADTLPRGIETTHFAICNTDVSTGSGIHWFVLYKSSSSKLEAFDSLSFTDTKILFLRQNCKFKGIKEIEFNETQFQSDTSTTCGKFVLYFIFMRLYNLDMSFKDLLNEIFVENQSINEQKIENFYSKVLTSHGFK